jgi:hypothetical protein
MLRTVETLFVVILVFTTLYGVQSYIQLPSPRLSSSIGLQEYAASVLMSMDNDGTLTRAAFTEGSEWSTELLRALDSTLPANTIYRLTSYQIVLNSTTGKLQYIESKTGPSGVDLFPSGSVSSTYIVTSPDVTVTQEPEKISSVNGTLTLYILNCNDANGWWITGFTGQTLASDVYKMMSPYFETTILVNSTAQLNTLLSGSPITSNPKERVSNAVVINTFGEAVPMPASQAATYLEYPYSIGMRVNLSNWTWVSIVGYPFFYASNTVSFAANDNGYGIYGVKQINSKGLNYFLQGLDYKTYPAPVENAKWITKEIPGVVYYTKHMRETQDYYGLYSGVTQTSTRALGIEDLANYHLSLPVDSTGQPYTNIFLPVQVDGKQYYAGATWVHKVNGVTRGSFMALGLARTPDIRVSLIGLLGYYQPSLHRTEYSASGTTRIIELQVGQLGAS